MEQQLIEAIKKTVDECLRSYRRGKQYLDGRANGMEMYLFVFHDVLGRLDGVIMVVHYLPETLQTDVGELITAAQKTIWAEDSIQIGATVEEKRALALKAVSA